MVKSEGDVVQRSERDCEIVELDRQTRC